MVSSMNSNLSPLKSIKSIKSVVFRTKLYYAKADQRLRMPPLPKELTVLARELEGREVWAILLSLDREIEIELPWIVVKRMKQIVFSEAKDEKDIRDALGFLAFDTVNSYLRLLFPTIPTVLYRDPEHIEVRRGKIAEYDVVWIRASGFTIYPTQAGEKITDAIIIEAELFNVPDDKDAFAWSYLTIKINLKKLLEELQIRWDILRT